MKKLIIIPIILLILSCNKKVEPIEKYSGKGYVVIEKPMFVIRSSFNYYVVTLKCKDSIFIVRVPTFDATNLKTGDTLK